MTKELTISKSQLPATTFEQDMSMASALVRSGLIQNFRTPEAAYAAILYGREIGFSPMQSLHALNVIQGRVGISAAGLAALALKAGGTIQEVEHTDQVCTLELTRGSTKRQFTFTLKEAERMGLLTKDNWRKMPKAMLYARAVSIGVRYLFADHVLGLYSTEELQDSVLMQEPTKAAPPTVFIAEPPKVDEAVQAPASSAVFQYDLGGLDPEKLPAAVKMLKAVGAVTEDENMMLWESPKQLQKLKNYEVRA